MRRRSSVALGFVALIFAGALVLSSPWARTAGTWGDFLPAVFTACSAVCVTGLTVVDIAREFTFAGQIALLLLVELGCLGLMTCGTFLLVAIGRRLSLAREFSLMNAYGVAEVQGLKGLIVWVIGSMLTIETLCAAVLWTRFHDVYRSVFFSIMSFCNAGFSLESDSIASFAGDPLVIVTFAMETILGGIGFLVIFNLCTYRFLRRKTGARGRLSLHTKVVLRMTAWLLALSFLAFLALEWKGTLASFPGWQKIWVAFYQAVTPRTCGFCIIPTETLSPLTRHLYELLMFIGGAPGSAAAGIKVTTLVVLLYTLTAMCRGEEETVVSRRVIPTDIVRESLVIVLALATLIGLTFAALLLTDSASGLGERALFFEAVSAITTTGLALGETTACLSVGGKVVVMFAMFAGRLGALSVVMLIGDRETKRRYRYPNEELVVG